MAIEVKILPSPRLNVEGKARENVANVSRPVENARTYKALNNPVVQGEVLSLGVLEDVAPQHRLLGGRKTMKGLLMALESSTPRESLLHERACGREGVCAEQRGSGEERHTEPCAVGVSECEKPQRLEEAVGCEG
jgi:hypothetical protein